MNFDSTGLYDPHLHSKLTVSILIIQFTYQLFCPSWSCAVICCINRFTSLCKNLFNLLEFLAQAFRCHVHHFQCLTVPVELAAMFFGCVFQLFPPSRVHSIENGPNLLLQNATVVLAIIHPQALLLVFLVVPCYTFGCSLVCSSLIRMPTLPLSYSKAVLSFLLCSECDDPNWFLCEALCGFRI